MKNIREEVRKLLSELLFTETVTTATEPPFFEEFDMGSEFQYGFKTENGNVYYLSLKQTKVKTKNQDVIEASAESLSDDGIIGFYAVNFYSSDENPNNSVAFSQITGVHEQFAILSHLVWLINYFSEKHNEDRIMFSAEPRRMKLYSNAFDNFKDNFHIFGPDNFDSSYEHNQVLMIKK